VARRSAGTAAPPAAAAPARTAVVRRVATRAPGAAGKAAKAADAVRAHRDRKTSRLVAKSLRPPAARWRTLLVAEFLASMLITQLGPLTDKDKLTSPAKLMTRSSALMGVFLVLALVSTGGEQAAKIAAAFGGLVTVALAMSDRDVFVVLAKRLDDAHKGPAGPTAGAGDAVGSVAAGGAVAAAGGM